MPSPKSGTAGQLVAPIDPDVAFDADNAVPGEVEAAKANERQTQTGKYGSVQITPFKRPPANSPTTPGEAKKLSWIEIVLEDDDGNPVPGEPYSITMPDQTVQEGTLDPKGFARVDGIEPGTCQVGFPRLDGSTWKKG